MIFIPPPGSLLGESNSSKPSTGPCARRIDKAQAPSLNIGTEPAGRESFGDSPGAARGFRAGLPRRDRMVGEPLSRWPALHGAGLTASLSQPLKFVRIVAILQTENVGDDFIDLKVGEQW